MSDPVNPFASPLAELTPAPGEQWVRDLSPSLRATQVGLALVYYGIVVVLISVLAIVFGSFVARGGGAGIFMTLLVIGSMLGIVVGSILMFVGPLVCLAVPRETGAKGLIIGSVVFQLANIVNSVAFQVLPVKLPPAVALALSLFGLVGGVLFILFMKKLAEYVGRDDLSRLARNLLVTLGVLIGLGVGVAGVTFTTISRGFDNGPAVAMVLLVLGMIVVGLIVLVMYANLINGLRKALGGARPPQGRQAWEGRMP